MNHLFTSVDKLIRHTHHWDENVLCFSRSVFDHYDFTSFDDINPVLVCWELNQSAVEWSYLLITFFFSLSLCVRYSSSVCIHDGCQKKTRWEGYFYICIHTWFKREKVKLLFSSSSPSSFFCSIIYVDCFSINILQSDFICWCIIFLSLSLCVVFSSSREWRMTLSHF